MTKRYRPADYGVTPMMHSVSFSLYGETPEAIFILDNCDQTGGMSVTNAAEFVCLHCNLRYGNRRIIYRDTEGRWDELLHNEGHFMGFALYEGGLPK